MSLNDKKMSVTYTVIKGKQLPRSIALRSSVEPLEQTTRVSACLTGSSMVGAYPPPALWGDVLSRELERSCGKCVVVAGTSVEAPVAGAADEAFTLVGPRIQ